LYDWTQVTTFLEPKKLLQPFYAVYQDLGDPDSLPDDMWELDDRLIDTDMLQLEGEEANKVYLDLKSRALRKQQNEKKRKKMDEILDEDESSLDDASTSDKSSRTSIVGDDQKRIQ